MASTLLNETIYDLANIDSQLANNAQVGTRYYGGSKNTDHAFVKGYFQAFFELPAAIFNDSSINTTDATILTASAVAFTPHGDRTLNKADIIGQGNVGASFVTGQTVTRNFSLTFDMKWKKPAWTVFKKWSSAIIDPYTGLSNLSSFTQNNYKGRAMIVETMPVRLDSKVSPDIIADNIIKIYYYDGVFPETDFNSIFDSNVQSPDANVQLNAQFSFDGQPLDELNADTKALAVQNMINAKMYDSTIDYYTSLYGTK